MTTKSFTKDALIKAADGLRKSYRVFVPVKVGKFHEFKLFEDGDKPDFEYRKTRKSPKGLIFPQSERMLEYSIDEHKPDHHIMKESPKDYSPQVVFGIRPYDAMSFKVMDVNFDTEDYKDPWWIKRYAATTLVGICRNDLDSKMFATENFSGPYDIRGLDVALYDLGDKYIAKSLTEKGEKALAAMGGNDVSAAELAAIEKLTPDTNAPQAAPTDKIKEKVVNDLFDSTMWEDIANGCINCGACTFLCPTCWCFDIQDEIHKREGDRLRIWDSCMFPLYTLHASGHNPRGKKVQRVRNRFMHKIKYYLDKYEKGIMCVGCGRCVEACPVNIDIRRVCELMNNFTK